MGGKFTKPKLKRKAYKVKYSHIERNREKCKMIMMYKCVTGINKTEWIYYPTLASNRSRGHNPKLLKIRENQRKEWYTEI